MSFWCTKKWYLTIESLEPLTEYFGNHPDFDTYEEAMAFMQEFNADMSHERRANELDIIKDPPYLNPRHFKSHKGSTVEYLE